MDSDLKEKVIRKYIPMLEDLADKILDNIDKIEVIYESSCGEVISNIKYEQKKLFYVRKTFYRWYYTSDEYINIEDKAIKDKINEIILKRKAYDDELEIRAIHGKMKRFTEVFKEFKLKLPTFQDGQLTITKKE